jgi:hypothetical protein
MNRGEVHYLGFTTATGFRSSQVANSGFKEQPSKGLYLLVGLLDREPLLDKLITKLLLVPLPILSLLFFVVDLCLT